MVHYTIVETGGARVGVAGQALHEDINDYDKRREVLKDAFQANPAQCAGKNLLLFDDLHGSGATTAHIVEVLKAAGAKAVYLLTLTTK